CSTSHPKWGSTSYASLRELEKEKIIGREETSGTRRIIEKLLFKADYPINMYMELGSTQAIKKAVEIDLGIAILSNLAIKNEVMNGTLNCVHIKEVSLKRNLWIVRKRRKF